MIDCSGKTVLPGFIDAHCHLYALADSYVTLNLEPHNNLRSISDIPMSWLLRRNASACRRGLLRRWVNRYAASGNLLDRHVPYPSNCGMRTGYLPAGSLEWTQSEMIIHLREDPPVRPGTFN